MKPTHIEHIGIAVSNLETSVRFYEDVLGLHCYGVEEVEGQNVRTAFFRVGQTKVELVESTTPDGPIAKFIEKRGEGIHHVAFAVDGLSDALKEVEAKGVHIIDSVPGRGAENFQVAFLHPKSTHGVLIELCAAGVQENSPG